MPLVRDFKPTEHISPIIGYSLVLFFLGVGDSLMSYSTPIYIESKVNSAFLMGIILSTSSLFGMFLDFIISKKFWNRKYVFFIKLAFLTTLFFPLILIFMPGKPLFFVMAMLTWGAYYEFKGFSNFNFIHKHMSPDKHALAWSILNTFNSIAYFIGPMISVLLLEIGEKTSFYAAILPFAVAALTFHFFRKKFHGASDTEGINLLQQQEEKNIVLETGIIKSLISRAWPMVIFGASLWLLDSSFWTIGTLYSQELKEVNRLGSFFFAAYMIPPIFTSLLAPHIYSRFGKKKTAFTAALVSALMLLIMSISTNIIFILVCVFLVSVFSNLALILNYAVFEDFVARLNRYGNDMVAMEQISASLAYVIGPVLLGYISTLVGYQHTFSFVGILIGSISIACLVAVPRKIKMPQMELKHLNSN